MLSRMAEIPMMNTTIVGLPPTTVKRPLFAEPTTPTRRAQPPTPPHRHAAQLRDRKGPLLPEALPVRVRLARRVQQRRGRLRPLGVTVIVDGDRERCVSAAPTPHGPFRLATDTFPHPAGPGQGARSASSGGYATTSCSDGSAPTTRVNGWQGGSTVAPVDRLVLQVGR